MKNKIQDEMIDNLKTTLEEAVLTPSDIKKNLVNAVLKDIFGVLVKIPTGTLFEGSLIANKVEKFKNLEWRLFVFEYGEKVAKS